MKTLDRKQVRQLDARAVSEYGLSSLVLMENAGRGVADLLCGLAKEWGLAPSTQQESSANVPAARCLSPFFRGGHAVICCGKGNNGGDGCVAARHLDLRQMPVEVFLFADPTSLTGDAAANFRVLEKSGVPIRIFAGEPNAADLAALSSAAWIIDALLGTGSTGDPRPPLNRVISAINAAGKPILAVDLPSGLDCDTGKPGTPTIRATHTCTFVAAKPGFFAPGAAEYTGELHIADIGAPRKLVEEMLAEHNPPSPQR